MSSSLIRHGLTRLNFASSLAAHQNQLSRLSPRGWALVKTLSTIDNSNFNYQSPPTNLSPQFLGSSLRSKLAGKADKRQLASSVALRFSCLFPRAGLVKTPELFQSGDFAAEHILNKLPRTVNDPRILTPAASFILEELERLEPESIRRQLIFQKRKAWYFAITSHGLPSASKQTHLEFLLRVFLDKTSSKDTIFVKLIKIQGIVDLGRDLVHPDRPTQELVSHIVELVSDFHKSQKDKNSEFPAADLVDKIVRSVGRQRHDLIVSRCSVEFDSRESLPTMSCTTDFGVREMAFRQSASLKAQNKSRFFLALGSNVGNRLDMIESACREMEDGGIHIVRTSGMWETKAMYVKDQSNFLNAVCEVECSGRYQSPQNLIVKLKEIEQKLGRVKVIEKGPRSIDLDILLWNHSAYEHDGTKRKCNPRLEQEMEQDLVEGKTQELSKVMEQQPSEGQGKFPLSIPHKLMFEREFVLRPLCELIPKETPPPPFSPKTFETHLRDLVSREVPMSIGTSSTTMSTQVSLSPSLSTLAPLLPSRKTQVMSILNLTPDSFSDGGLHDPDNISALKTTIAHHLSSDATIIDIGGQSSKPGAIPITAKEELSRILPAIFFLKDHEKTSPEHGFAISIDTYRAVVAEQAIAAGAHIINDISAGNLDPAMLPTVAKLGCTYILMHMRGTPETMTNSSNTTYNGDLIEIIGTELLSRVKAAEDAGIRRWRLILDPGIGFAKTLNQNLEILRRFKELRDFPGLQGMPWVVGVSRKGFIGKITGVMEAKDRVMGTAAAVTAAIQGGADIVRVHDVEEMGQVVKMADAVYRGWAGRALRWEESKVQ